MAARLEKLRNFGIMAHIDAGKTTTTERIVYYAKLTHRSGNVDEGTTVTDWMTQEQARGITITSAAVALHWRDCEINLIDTPGHVDFTVEVERCLRVLDGAVVVLCGVGGIEAQTETVWRQADQYHVPRVCYVNKLDRTGADYEKVIAGIEGRLRMKPLVIQLPIGIERDFRGVIDLLEMKAYEYSGEGVDTARVEIEIPAEMAERAAQARETLVEKVAEEVDEIGEKFIAEEEIGVGDLKAGIRKLVCDCRATTVQCGSSLKFKGPRLLMDAVCDFLPSPLEVKPAVGRVPGKDTLEECPPDPAADLAALAFKIATDRYDDLTYVRVYSGTLRVNKRVYNPRKDMKENLTRIYRMRANRREESLKEAGPGDIVGLVGLRHTTTGDTICDAKKPILLEEMLFPATVIDMAIEPKKTGEKEKFEDALKRLAREDPTFETRVDRETGQLLISGMGELHLDVLRTRLAEDFNVEVNVGAPRVAYKETIAQPYEVEERFARQAGGGTPMFAAVKLRVAPKPLNAGVSFVSQADPEAIDVRFVEAVKRTVLDAAHGGGGRTGYPVINVEVILLDAEQHETDSNEVAFEAAASAAFRHAMEEASEKFGPVLLEPIMALEVVVPEAYMGDTIGDLNGRRAAIESVEDRGELKVISARAPLSEMFGYATALRSLTQGRGTHSMEPCDYAKAPPKVCQQLIV